MSSANVLNRFALSAATIAAVLLLSACPKKEWHYTPPAAPAPAKDFDVHFDANNLDPNGSPRNVDWQPQLQGHIPNPDSCSSGQPYSAACTQDKPFQDQPDGLHEAFCFIGKRASGSTDSFFGHADWMVSQYNGSIGWFNFGDDGDYDLFLIPGADNLPSAPPNEHGITTNNNHVTTNTSPQYIEMEFDSAETDPAFTHGWWSEFMSKGEANDDLPAIADLLHPGKTTLACGSAVGLFGLDCDHGCRSELHPIYGLAIQRTEDPKDNEWSVMARNWGTGGYCSQYNDELAETSMSLLLPYTSSQQPSSAEIHDFHPAPTGAQVGCPIIYFHNGQTILNLTLPPPEQRAVAAFALKLQWPDGAQPVACTQPSPTERVALALAHEAPTTHGIKGEEYMGALLRAASQAQNPGLKHLSIEKDILPAAPKSLARMQSMKSTAPAAQPAQPCEGPLTIKGGLPPPAPKPQIHTLKKDVRKQIRDDAVRTVICQNYKKKPFALPPNTSQQDFDQACKGVK